MGCVIYENTMKTMLCLVKLSIATLDIGSNNDLKHIASKNKLTRTCQRVQNFELTRTSQNNAWPCVHLSHHDGQNTVTVRSS